MKKIKQAFFFSPCCSKITEEYRHGKEEKGGTSALLLAHRESNCKGFFLHV